MCKKNLRLSPKKEGKNKDFQYGVKFMEGFCHRIKIIIIVTGILSFSLQLCLHWTVISFFLRITSLYLAILSL